MDWPLIRCQAVGPAGWEMHILVIYMTYLRPGDAGIRRFSDLSRLWVERHGHQVSVITSQLHYNCLLYTSDAADE